MDKHIVVPVLLFVCVTYIFKALIDARLRWQMFNRGGSEELVRMLVDAEAKRRRAAALHWGTVLLALGLGLIVASLLGWRDLSMTSAGLIIGATALGQLAYYRLSRLD